MEPMKLLDMET